MGKNGFDNETQIKEEINEKIYPDLNTTFKRIIKESFSNYRDSRIICKKEGGPNKSDLLIEMNKSKKQIRLSIKKGSGNSVHQEPIEDFLKYLEEEFNISENLKNDFRLFIWGDDTLNGKGEKKDRLSATDFKKKFPEVVKRLASFMHLHRKKFIERFVVLGPKSNQKKDYLLEENDLEKIKFKIIPESGISIKRIDSIKYQILKMSPNTFKKVFGNYELGAGASIYCNEKELEKNKSVLRGWKTNEQEILSFFKEENLNLDSCKRIKTKSNQNIFEMINTIKKISDFVFKGTGNFEEPFLANWFYERGNLSKSEKIPFIITTGSGRSKGVFTLVVKPK